MASTKTTTANVPKTQAGETSIRIILFSGKRDEWETWKEKFLVRASIRGYEDLITGEEEIPKTHDIDGTKRILTKEEEALHDSNLKGYQDLIMSIECTSSAGKIAFAMVTGSKTQENPKGSVRAAYVRLKEKYEPSTTPQLMQLTRDFHSKTLIRNQDPGSDTK
jgi:hypothetical protein